LQRERDAAFLFDEGREPRPVQDQPRACAAHVSAAVPLDDREQASGGEVSPEKQALAVFWSHKRFWALQTVGIAAWTALALAWFWLPDSRVWGVALAALQGLAVIFGGLWLIGTALVFYRKAHAGNDLNLGAICQESLRRIPALLAWATILALALWALLK